MLVPYSWFQILWYFYIYGFLGWCSEVAFAAVAHGKFVNRGFVNGPICSIYGFGVMSVLLVLGPLKSSLWLLFGGSVLFTSAIEYLTGWVLEKVFHDKWWDYSKRPLNIKGYVCLEFSVLWGLACVFVVDVFQPLVAKVVDLIPKKLGWVLLGTFSALWIADNIITAMEIRKLPKKLRALQAIEDSLTAISDEIGEEIYIRTSDAKDRGMEVYTGMKEKSTELAQKRAEASVERRSELLARRSELLQRREEILSHRNIVHERIAQAFPALRSGQVRARKICSASWMTSLVRLFLSSQVSTSISVATSVRRPVGKTALPVRSAHLFVSRPFQVFVLQYRPAVPFPHLVQAVLREVAVDHRQRTPQAVVQVARHQHRDSRLAAAAFLCGESHVQCLSVHIVILLVIHPAARAAASLFTQSVSFSATLPFIHSSVHSFRHPVIHSARHPAVHSIIRLSNRLTV